MQDVLLETMDLKKYFSTARGQLHAVDNVSIRVPRGKTLGVVGESGCGKSTLGRTLIHLLESTGGRIMYENRDITRLGRRELRQLRKEMQIIFQDPFASLDPRYTIEDAIREPLELLGTMNRSQVNDEIDRLMHLVGIDERLRNAYPHELDGGRRQRVVIARALAPKPRFIVCDEPVSALDVSIQAQVLNLLQDLQQEMGLTYLFITHDLSVVRYISEEICVMYLGQVIEQAPADELFDHPLHPYTKALLSAIPSVDIHCRPERVLLKGEITSPIEPKPGCRFAPRCPYAAECCGQEQRTEKIAPDHFAACCRVHEINQKT